MIRIENLSVSYKETLALKDISLVLHGPTITGIIGPRRWEINTIIKGIGNYPTSQYRIILDDKEVKKSLHRIAYVKQKINIEYNSHQNQGKCISRTISLYSSLSKFKG